MFIAFFKVGLFTFGGGLRHDSHCEGGKLSRIRVGLPEEELMDYYGISQVSMGIIAINTSALMGYRIDKEKGALIAADCLGYYHSVILCFVYRLRLPSYYLISDCCSV